LNRNVLKFFPLWFALLSLAACSSVAVRGSVDGQMIDTRVDSKVARYYVENYLAGKRNDKHLDARIDQVYQNDDGKLPDDRELKKLSDEFSVDFAALYFADRIAQVPANRRFRSDFNQFYKSTTTALAEGKARLPETAAHYEALIVPTYLYKRNLATGSALTAPRQALEKVGMPCYFVETQDDGPVESNAELIMAAVRKRAQDGRRLIIISASKSSAEVALALTKLGPAETRHVAAWINAVGALKGTPLIDDNVMPDIEWVVGKIDPAGTASMTAAESRQRFKSFHVPERIFIVNLMGIPMSGSVGFKASFGYFPMRKHGPNDGFVLLADTIYPGGVTLTELGMDHFILYNVEALTVSLVSTIIRWLENPAGTTTAAAP
jgi:hypothetical protein